MRLFRFEYALGRLRVWAVVMLTLLAGFVAAQTEDSQSRYTESPKANEGTVRLRQTPLTRPTTPQSERERTQQLELKSRLRNVPQREFVEREPDEFERFVSELAGVSPDGEPIRIRRFGTDLQRQAIEGEETPLAEPEPLPLVPQDYVVNPGDELRLTLWGSVDADLLLPVDRTGRIAVPRVGSVVVAGLRFSELADAIRRRVAMTFRNFDLSVSMGALRGVRVFVTGFVSKPGVYTLRSLSTVSQAVFRAGGPATAGSYRQIVLRRAGQAPQTLDLYDLLVKGERRSDIVLRPDDVVFVGPVGTQVAMIGSVNQPAIFELRPGETVRDVIQMAGGQSPVADASRITLERLRDRDTARVIQVPMAETEGLALVQGDVLRSISVVVS